MKKALITGITGQDGSYLAELLLNKGYEVYGIVRRASTFTTGRIGHLYDDPHNQPKLKLIYGDLTDGNNLSSILNDVKPDEVYNLAAQSHVRVSFDQPIYSVNAGGLGTLRMLEAIHNDKTWHSSFSGWLYRIAHNLVIDHYRVRDRQKQVSIDDVPVMPDPGNNPVKAAEIALDSEYLKSAIRRLTDDQAQVVTLRFLEGYSFSEIADMMDKTEGAVKALQHRAVTTLRKLMNPD